MPAHERRHAPPPTGHRVLPRRSLLWRVFASNALVLTAAIVLLAVLPVTVSRPVTVQEALVLVGGLILMLVVNLLLMRRALAPLRRLSDAMGTVDPLLPTAPIDVGAHSVEVAELTSAFNDMRARLERERCESTRLAQVAQEEQRRELSLELHDEVGQNLTALLLQLDVALRTASPEQRPAIETSLTTVRDSLDRVRGIVRGLRPEALDDLGLARALNHLCERVARDSGLKIEREVDRDLPPLGAEVQLVVYRVAQECLTNTIRHAGADAATVRLASHDGGVRLRVVDDGSGIAGGTREGSGIRGMRERALMIGAALQVSGSERGTEIVLDVPGEQARR